MSANRNHNKKIAPAALHALKEALSKVYWYKSDLRSFLTHCLNDTSLVSRLDWQEYKRNVVAGLVDFLAKNENVYQRELLRLMHEVSTVDDFSHLERLDDGVKKAKDARSAVLALRKQIAGLKSLLDDEGAIEKRRKDVHDKLLQVTAVQEKLHALTKDYLALLADEDAQGRGFKLEKILRELFELFDLDPKASFRIVGEQIDGAFTFDKTDYLLEAKWQQAPVFASDLDVLAGRLSRKLDNTLGLFLSVNGFSPDGVQTHSSGRRLMILMDGSDLMAVLEGRIDLIALLLRKRREAAQTGNIYLKIHEILT
jgi:hypothetical protein